MNTQCCHVGVYSKTQTLLATLRTQKINLSGCLVFLWKPKISTHQLDVQENNRQYPTVPQNLKLFRWMLECEWMDYCSRPLGRGDCVQTTLQDQVDKPKETCAGQEINPSIKTRSQTPTEKRKREVEHLSDVDYVPTNTHSSQGESQLYIFEDNEAVINMIIKGRKSNDETRVQNPQSCS